MSARSNHTAIISAWGQLPVYTPTTLPVASPGEIQIKVLAAGLHRLVQNRGAGTHYSSGLPPHIPGIDGVGHRVSDNKLVYFLTYSQPCGSFQDYVNVPERMVAELPEGVDPVQVAAYTNPVMSSWMAFTTRVQGLQKGFSVLILGATGTSGSIAVEVARALGADKVVGVGRNETALNALDLDVSIVLETNVTQTDFSAAAYVDVVLDYLYGPVAHHLLSSVKFKRHVQYVQIGSIAGDEVPLRGGILRSQNITMRGSGFGSFSNDTLFSQMPAILEIFKKIRPLPVKALPLPDVGSAWGEMNERVVFTP